jgi:hypothetical protein
LKTKIGTRKISEPRPRLRKVRRLEHYEELEVACFDLGVSVRLGGKYWNVGCEINLDFDA